MTTKKTAKKKANQKAPKKPTIKEFSCRFSSDLTNAELMRLFKANDFDCVPMGIQIWDAENGRFAILAYTRGPKFTDLGEK